MPVLSPSLLSCDFLNIENELEKLKNAGIQRLHYDVMDGHFVPNLTFGPDILKALKKKYSLAVDVHLMVQDVSRFIPMFLNADADLIAVHIENTNHIHKEISTIKDAHKKAGLVLNPATPWELCKPMMPFIDQILFMTVNPGFGGQKMISDVLNKVADFKKFRDDKGYHIEIAVDGGVNALNAQNVVNKGGEVLIVGSAFFDGSDYAKKRIFYEGLMVQDVG